MRFTGIVAALFLACKLASSQQPPPVTSALVENVQLDPERKAVRFDIRNLGTKSITGVEAFLTEIGPAGNVILCNGGGQDMLDWSDPMPGTEFYVNMRRSWIQPNSTLQSVRYLSHCKELLDSPQNARIELRIITFDDGTSEGDPNLINFFYRYRKITLEERLKWLPRFVALRTTADLAGDAKRLYQDLTDAKYRVESDTAAADSNALTRSSLEKLQGVAREIVVYSETHRTLEPESIAAWRITDLEQRTARMIRGIGSPDIASQ